MNNQEILLNLGQVLYQDQFLEHNLFHKIWSFYIDGDIFSNTDT